MRTKIIFSVFALLIVSLGIVYFTSPTLRDRLSSFFLSFFSSPQVIVPEKVYKTFTGITWDKPKDGTKSITYTLRFPVGDALAQQMNNEGSQITIPGSYESTHMYVYYKPDVKTLDDAWQTLSQNELKPLLGATLPQKEAKSSIVIPEADTVEYTAESNNFALTRFEQYPEWIFVFKVLATTKKPLLAPILKTLTVISAK